MAASPDLDPDLADLEQELDAILAETEEEEHAHSGEASQLPKERETHLLHLGELKVTGSSLGVACLSSYSCDKIIVSLLYRKK